MESQNDVWKRAEVTVDKMIQLLQSLDYSITLKKCLGQRNDQYFLLMIILKTDKRKLDNLGSFGLL